MPVVEVKNLQELRMLINTLKQYRGYATTLISLYVNANRPIADVTNFIRQEWATSSNIKDKTTRTHVQDTLERIANQLKGEHKAPENGIAIFAGFHMVSPGSYEWVFYIVIPPRPITTFKYICDTQFHTEILEEMATSGNVYGIIVIERGEAVIALLKGNYWEVVKKVEFFVPGKHHAGGQSANRFKRQTEHLAETFYKLLGEEANKVFLNVPGLKGIIIAGPGPTKEDFIDGGYLDYRLRDKVVAVVPACCADISGVLEAIRYAWDKLEDVEYVRAKKLMDEIMYYAIKKSNYIVYGRENVLKVLEGGLAKKVILSEDLGNEEVIYVTSKAYEKGVSVEIIPRTVEENVTLMKAFGGYVALLRAPIWTVPEESSES